MSENAAIKRFAARYRDYWGERFEESCSYDAALARALLLRVEAMEADGSCDGIKSFLNAWRYIWGSKAGAAHPKYFDGDICELSQELKESGMTADPI